MVAHATQPAASSALPFSLDIRRAPSGDKVAICSDLNKSADSDSHSVEFNRALGSLPGVAQNLIVDLRGVRVTRDTVGDSLVGIVGKMNSVTLVTDSGELPHALKLAGFERLQNTICVADLNSALAKYNIEDATSDPASLAAAKDAYANSFEPERDWPIAIGPTRSTSIAKINGLSTSFEDRVELKLVGSLGKEGDLAEKLLGLLKQHTEPKKHLHLDLSEIDSISKEAVAVMLGHLKHLKSSGQSLLIINPSDGVTEALRPWRIASIFGILDQKQAA